MAVDLILRGGHVVTPAGVIEADIAIDRGALVAVGAVDDPSHQEINATGLHVFPGLIDPHVHFNDPGRADWEGLDTGSAALTAGGGTSFFDMPLNSSPPVLDGPAFDAKHERAAAHSRADFGLWGGLTPGNLDHMDQLADRGVIGFKAFMCGSGIDDFTRADDDTLQRGMVIAARRGLPVAVHAESEAMTAQLTANAQQRHATSWADFLATRPVAAEVAAVQTAIALAQATGCRLHVVHVSSPEAAALVRATAADVTCETCPHYLSFTADDLPRLGARAKCAPPLRPADTVAALWDDLAAGVFAFVASDHSPAPPSMKQGDDAFAAWGGIAGVQSTRAVLLTREPPLPLPQIAALTSAHAADRFNLRGKGRIAVGHDADLALIDLNAHDPLTRDALLDRHRLSPYVGRTFRGRVTRTLVRGQTVFHDGKTVGSFRGRLLRPHQAGGTA